MRTHQVLKQPSHLLRIKKVQFDDDVISAFVLIVMAAHMNMHKVCVRTAHLKDIRKSVVVARKGPVVEKQSHGEQKLSARGSLWMPFSGGI